MSDRDWPAKFDGSVTVCDKDGVILSMNDAAAKGYEADGGRALLGKNVLDCHPEPARTELREMLREGRTNVYTILKKGRKKLIYQAPWRDASGAYAGFVELSLVLPETMPHFDRDAPRKA